MDEEGISRDPYLVVMPEAIVKDRENHSSEIISIEGVICGRIM